MAKFIDSDSCFLTGEEQLRSSTFMEIAPLYCSQNGYSRLYKAKRLGKWFVLKCLKEEYSANPFYHTLLQKEFEIGYHLSHPGIVQTINLEVVIPYGSCIIMEYIDGTTLREYITQKKLTHELTFKFILELCDALSYIHEKQIIHRDLKPENILITNNGRNIKLIDFGFSDTDDYAILKEPAGTRKYAAPEQFDNQTVGDAQMDIYTLGNIIRELNHSLRTPSRRLSTVSSRCLKNEKKKRYHSVNEIIHFLKSRELGIRNRIFLLSAIVLTASYFSYHMYKQHDMPLPLQARDTIYIKTYDTLVLRQTDTITKERIEVLHDFNQDKRLTYLNDFSKATTLRMMREVDDLQKDTTLSLIKKSKAINNVYFEIETIIKKEVDRTIDSSTPEHSIYLSTAISIISQTMREYNQKKYSN